MKDDSRYERLKIMYITIYRDKTMYEMFQYLFSGPCDHGNISHPQTTEKNGFQSRA